MNLTYVKAVVALLVAGLGSLYTATADNTPITLHQYIASAVSALIAFGGVMFANNNWTIGKTDGKKKDDGTNTP